LASWHPGADDGGFKIWDTRHVSAGHPGVLEKAEVSPTLPEVGSLLEWHLVNLLKLFKVKRFGSELSTSPPPQEKKLKQCNNWMKTAQKSMNFHLGAEAFLVCSPLVQPKKVDDNQNPEQGASPLVILTWRMCGFFCIYTIHTWNLFVLYFGGWTLQNKVFSNQNKGHLGSRYIYI